MEKWEQELRRQLENTVGKKPEARVAPKAKDNWPLVWIVVIAFAAVNILMFKDRFKLPECRPADHVEKAAPDLDERVRWNQRRIAVLGAMINENFLILRNNLDRSEMIFLDREWRMNKMPSHLQLTPEDREFLERNVR